jgi:hypothetical protein
MGPHIPHLDVLKQDVPRGQPREIARYKVEALLCCMEMICAKGSKLQHQQHTFQVSHFQGGDTLNKMQYESKCCWATLIALYLNEAELPICTGIHTISGLMGMRAGIG